MRGPHSSSSAPAARPRLRRSGSWTWPSSIPPSTTRSTRSRGSRSAPTPSSRHVPGPASGDAAVAAAGRGTLLALFPARSVDIEAWYAASLAAVPDGDEEDERHLGRRADRRRDPRPASERRTQRGHPDRGAARGHGRLGPHASRFRGAPGALGPIHHALEHQPPVAVPARASAAAPVQDLSDGLRGGAGLRRRRGRVRDPRAAGHRPLLGRPAHAPVEPGVARDRPLARTSRAWMRRASSRCSRPQARTP